MADETLYGIDISHHQDGIDLAKVDVDFVMIKSTEGSTYTDPAFTALWDQAGRAHLRRGIYHFWRGGGAEEADYFVSVIGRRAGAGVLALDWESETIDDIDAARAFLDRVVGRTGVWPLIYMSASVANVHDWSLVAPDYGLWIARWGGDVPGDTGAWDAATIWQYADDLPAGSMLVDADVFYGSGADWDDLAAGQHPPRVPPVPAPPTPAPPTPDGALDVDGYWGSTTTAAIQRIAGHDDDGIVSSQDSYWQAPNPGLTTGWQWVGTSAAKGSQIIAWIQHQVGAGADGLAGPDTFAAMQRHFGTTVDGVVSRESAMVMAMQNALNDGHF